MAIETLKLANFRNFQDLTLTFTPGLNIVKGLNGSGKTTILEAINILSTGRSFRTVNLSKTINIAASNKENAIYAKVLPSFTIGYSRNSLSERRIRLNNKEISTISEVAKIFVVSCLENSWFRALNLTPQYRRRMLDWGVFHVKHEFLDAWKKYNSILKQRNLILRTKKGLNSLDSWDYSIAEAMYDLIIHRQAYYIEVDEVFAYYLRTFGLDKLGVRLKIKHGIDTEGLVLRDREFSITSMKRIMLANREKDLERGYTNSGPHRADLVFSVDKGIAKDFLSRGQQKMVMLAYFLAQINHYRSFTGKNCTVLIDDIAAELDRYALDLLYAELDKLEHQVVITVITNDYHGHARDDIRLIDLDSVSRETHAIA